MKHLTSIAVIVAYIVMLVVNGLAGSGAINDTSPGAISDLYSTAVSPAGYAFSIWSVIYLAVGAFSVWQLLPAQRNEPGLEPVRRWFLASCAANIAWLFSWHYLLIPLSLGVMLVLLATLVQINRAIGPVDGLQRFALLGVPFGLYTGWIVVATSLNVLITLAYFDLSIAQSTAFGAALIAVVAIAGLALRKALQRHLLPVAMAWGIVAIAVRNSDDTLLLVTSVGAALVLAASGLPWQRLRERGRLTA